MRSILKLLGVSVALLLLLALAGFAWFWNQWNATMVPPPNPEGQPSIAVYAEQGSLAPEVTLQPQPAFLWNSIDRPPVSASPWTRWWWPGGDVDIETVKTELQRLRAAGFGGVEIQPFLGGMLNVMEDAALLERVYKFDTPAYYDTLDATLLSAADLGLQVDLTHFSGWPPGGPQVNLEDSNTILAHAEVAVSGGGTVDIALPRPKAGPSEKIFGVMELAGADFTNFPVEHARLLSVSAARVEAGERHWNSFRLDDTVVLEADSLVVLTDKVTGNRLHWQAPTGDWLVIAHYLLPSGEVPMGAAQKPQGFVVDHLRRPQVIGHYEYAFGERSGLAPHYGKGLRGFFNDSLEFRLKRMAVEDILPAFRRLRGYNLEPLLPVIHVEGFDNVYFREILGYHAAPEFRLTSMDERIRFDYQRTLSDLVIERFIETSAHWASQRGLLSRGQSYGMDIDLLRALGANHIPETEQLWAGGANVGLKFASSAAALYGRNLTSAESFVWIRRDFQVTPRRLKAAADKLLLAGINHIVYHGTAYPWNGGGEGRFGEEGWHPFSGPENPAHFSGHYGATNPVVWPDLPALNSYLGRSQHLLRQGAPALDVLVYYPFLGFHGPNPENPGESLVNGDLPDADPAHNPLVLPAMEAGKAMLDKLVMVPADHEDSRVAWVEALQPLLHGLERRGISWGWINDHALQTGLASAGMLTASGGRYQAILLPDVEAIDQETLTALQREIEQGIPVIIAGELPSRQRGFQNAAEGDAAVRRQVEALLNAGAETMAMEADDLLSRFRSIGYGADSNIQRITRLLEDDATITFFANQSAVADSVELPSSVNESAWWFDAQSGSAWPADSEAGWLTLSGFDSRFLISGMPMPTEIDTGKPVAAQAAAVERHLADWHLAAAGQEMVLEALVDWRDLPALKHAAQGVYRHELMLDALTESSQYVLDLGLVQGAAEVSINGLAVGRASLPPFRLDITSELKPGTNVIEVAVTAPLRNSFVGRALAGDPLYSHMLGYENGLVAAGLMGPVRLLRMD